MQLVGSECIGTAVDPPIITTRKLSHATQSKQMTTKRRCFSIDDVIGLLDGDDEEVMASDSDEDYEDLMTEESEDEAEANDLDNEVNNTAAAGPCIHGLDANEIVSALDASAEGYTNQDKTGDLQGDAEDPQPSIQSKTWKKEVHRNTLTKEVKLDLSGQIHRSIPKHSRAYM